MTKVVAIFKDRLNEALEKRGIRPVDLANKVDIPESTISQYRSGYAKPKYERIVKIADALNVSVAWLMGGDVSMEKERGPVEINKLDVLGRTDVAGLTDREKRFISLFQNVAPDVQEAVETFLKSAQQKP